MAHLHTLSKPLGHWILMLFVLKNWTTSVHVHFLELPSKSGSLICSCDSHFVRLLLRSTSKSIIVPYKSSFNYYLVVAKLMVWVSLLHLFSQSLMWCSSKCIHPSTQLVSEYNDRCPSFQSIQVLNSLLTASATTRPIPTQYSASRLVALSFLPHRQHTNTPAKW